MNMISLIKLNHLSKILLKKPVVSFIYIRQHWNKDYKPGSFPTTPEEHMAAAKKYNLLPQDYKPYPDDGMGHGDYPNLPMISTDQKDSYYPYDFPEMKRNFQEPIHLHIEFICEERYDYSKPLRYPMWKQILSFFGWLFVLSVVYVKLERMKMFRPVLRKQYPNEAPHYTFKIETNGAKSNSTKDSKSKGTKYTKSKSSKVPDIC